MASDIINSFDHYTRTDPRLEGQKGKVERILWIYQSFELIHTRFTRNGEIKSNGLDSDVVRNIYRKMCDRSKDNSSVIQGKGIVGFV